MEAGNPDAADPVTSSADIEISISRNLDLHVELEALKEDLSVLTSNVRVTVRPEGGLFNAIEWLIPAAVAIYVGKAFVDPFLKELGATAAKNLTKGITLLFEKAQRKNLRVFSSADLRKLENLNYISESVFAGVGRPVTPLSITMRFVETDFIFIFPFALDAPLLHEAMLQLNAMALLLNDEDQQRQKYIASYLNATEPDKASEIYLSGDFPRGRQQRLVFDVHSGRWIELTSLLREASTSRSNPRAEP
jgi:hypothetical protein